MNEEELFNEEWNELEKKVRENVENVLRETKRNWLKSLKPNAKKNVLPIVPIRFQIVDVAYGIPIYQSPIFDVFGTHQELAQHMENRMNGFLKDFQNSLIYKRNIYSLFAEMVNKYKMQPLEIYPLLHGNYESLTNKAKRKFQNSLRTNYKRLTRTKKPEKS